MKAEITADGGELTVTLDVDELPFLASDQSLAARLPGSAPGIGDGILNMLSERPEPGNPRPVRIVRVRLIRTEVIAETILELNDARQVYA